MLTFIKPWPKILFGLLMFRKKWDGRIGEAVAKGVLY